MLRSRLLSTSVIQRGSDHSFQYFATVMSELMPFICIAPSPANAIAMRSGKQNFAATAYGTAGPIVARLPEPDAIMPRRTLMSRAYQLADVPESADRMQSSGSRGDSSQKTRSGL